MMKSHIILPFLNRGLAILTLAMATSPLAAAPQDDTTSAQGEICSEMCIMAQSQDYLIEITSRSRPAWARVMLEEIAPYTVCGVRVISASGIAMYDDFDATDRAFDLAYTGCAQERAAFDERVRTQLLGEGVFDTAEEADAQIAPLRAMLFGVKMSSIFDAGGVNSKGDQYAASRFPEFYETFQSRPVRTPTPPPPAE